MIHTASTLYGIAGMDNERKNAFSGRNHTPGADINKQPHLGLEGALLGVETYLRYIRADERIKQPILNVLHYSLRFAADSHGDAEIRAFALQLQDLVARRVSSTIAVPLPIVEEHSPVPSSPSPSPSKQREQPPQPAGPLPKKRKIRCECGGIRGEKHGYAGSHLEYLKTLLEKGDSSAHCSCDGVGKRRTYCLNAGTQSNRCGSYDGCRGQYREHKSKQKRTVIDVRCFMSCLQVCGTCWKVWKRNDERYAQHVEMQRRKHHEAEQEPCWYCIYIKLCRASDPDRHRSLARSSSDESISIKREDSDSSSPKTALRLDFFVQTNEATQEILRDGGYGRTLSGSSSQSSMSEARTQYLKNFDDYRLPRNGEGNPEVLKVTASGPVHDVPEEMIFTNPTP